jgi:hypothetical protein
MAIICGALAPIGFMCEAMLLWALFGLSGLWSWKRWPFGLKAWLSLIYIVTTFLLLLICIVHALVTMFLVHALVLLYSVLKHCAHIRCTHIVCTYSIRSAHVYYLAVLSYMYSSLCSSYMYSCMFVPSALINRAVHSYSFTCLSLSD